MTEVSKTFSGGSIPSTPVSERYTMVFIAGVRFLFEMDRFYFLLK